jgi:hypothetical protein
MSGDTKNSSKDQSPSSPSLSEEERRLKTEKFENQWADFRNKNKNFLKAPCVRATFLTSNFEILDFKTSEFDNFNK